MTRLRRHLSWIALPTVAWLLANCGSNEADNPSGEGSGGSGANGTGGTVFIDAGPDGAAGAGDPCDVPDPPPECLILQAAGPACGDGEINQTDEECDDGNSLPGDGCTGACSIEPNHACPTPGEPCVSTIACGDGDLGGAEACDDGNTDSGDGCPEDCSFIEAGFACPTPGVLCDSTVVCGDGRVSSIEACDDGNDVGGDGCSADCRTLEDGYLCRTPGSACALMPVCGDGALNPGEACDDGNTAGGDGCSANCDAILQGWVCPTPGLPCQFTVVCGDGVVGGDEACDDGNTSSNDGCSDVCELEAGFACSLPGIACVPICGDGDRVGTEQCDDGNIANGDGCTATCAWEEGWACIGNPGAYSCWTTECNDGMREGTEPCDDGNNDMGDGCTPFCTLEPDCAAGACTSECGDGMMLAAAGEACDDGNNRSGDGCSGSCQVEPGYSCVQPPLGATLQVPVIYRDFKSQAAHGAAGHPDFEHDPNCWEHQITGVPFVATLDADGKPTYYGGLGCDDGGGPAHSTENQTWFDLWYRDSQYAITIPDYMTLSLAGINYQFYSSSFFPLNGRGWATEPAPNTEVLQGGNNFHFTSEVRYWFEYQGGEILSFTGDDDVWVYVNGVLALDLGGMHNPEAGVVAMDGVAAAVGLQIGNVYEIVVFQAERHTWGSNYQLMLANFNASQTDCESICGDGFRTRDEQCDDGVLAGGYNQCQAGCVLGPRCGDAQVQDGYEQCDDGLNLGGYGTGQCAPGCILSGFCGDGIVQFVEECDVPPNDGGYGGCNSDCTLAPYCGDGTVDANEECDDGVNDGLGDCAPDCRATGCGDGILQPGEQCDDGVNAGGYDGCNANCTLGPRCGDGTTQADQGEQCDDGTNDGGYGECAPGCTIGPRCGDGQVQSSNEDCDDGVNDGGYGECAPGCVLGPYCGDGVVQAPYEDCEDGNHEDHDGCSASCQEEAWVPR